jgi:hypothetical protein
MIFSSVDPIQEHSKRQRPVAVVKGILILFRSVCPAMPVKQTDPLHSSLEGQKFVSYFDLQTCSDVNFIVL